MEFDDVSNVAVTYSAEAETYKLWDLQDPVAPRFHISSQVRWTGCPVGVQMAVSLSGRWGHGVTGKAAHAAWSLGTATLG